jgi:hypothetical protein
MTLLMMHVNDPVPDIRQLNPDVPEQLVAVLQKALAKDRNNRYASAAEFAQALRAIDLGKPAASVPAPQATMVENEPMPVGSTTVEPQIPAGGATTIEPQAPAGGATTIEPPPPTGPASTGSGRATPSPAPSAPPKKKMSSGLLVGIIIGVIFLCVGGGGGGYYLFTKLTGDQDNEATPTAEVAVVAEEDTPTPESTATEAPPTPTEGPPTETPTPTIEPTPTVPPGKYVRINNISIENGYYIVEYETFEYTEALPGDHVHFFYDTVPPEQAGVPNSGPWIVWGGPRPFNGYTVASRPADAMQMCALVANPDHTINLGSGNCYELPSE